MGNYYRTRSHAKRIYQWVDDTIRDGSWRNHNDLHIDVINPMYDDFKHMSKWVDSAVTYYLIARQHVADMNFPFIVELYIPLTYKDVIGDYTVQNKQGIIKDIDHTPPSLYLFHKDEISNYKNDEAKRTELPNFLTADKTIKLFYCQTVDEEYSEVNRWVYME